MLFDLLIICGLYFGIVFILLYVEYYMGVRQIRKNLSGHEMTLISHRYHSSAGKERTNGVRIETIYINSAGERFYELFVYGSTGKLYRQDKKTGELKQVIGSS